MEPMNPKNLTPLPPFPTREWGLISKPLSYEERGLERGFYELTNSF